MLFSTCMFTRHVFCVDYSFKRHTSRSAAKDSLWRSMQSSIYVPFRIYNLEEQVFNAWTRTKGSEFLIYNSPIGFIHADRLCKMRDHALARPLISINDMVRRGNEIAKEDFEHLQLEEVLDRRKKPRSDQKAHTKGVSQSKAARFAKSGAGAENIQEIRKELAAALRKLEDVPPEGSTKLSTSPPVEQATSCLLSSLLARARIGSSCSTKLNYLLNEVCPCNPSSYQCDISFIGASIFSEGKVSDILQFPAITFPCCRRTSIDQCQIFEVHHTNPTPGS
jgi:hypothetical protein